jgi:hypothetical protein
MSSAIAICKLGLSHIGQKTNIQSIDPPDGSVEAAHCATFYPIARDMLLEMHDWYFSTRRVALAEVTNELDSWGFAYTYPAECVKPLALLLPESTDDTKTQEYITETLDNGQKIIYTNVEEAVFKYLVKVTDTTKYTPGFSFTLSVLLSSFLAGPLIKGREGREVAKTQYQLFTATKAEAIKNESNSKKKNNAYGAHHTPAHIAARSS